MIIIRGFWYDIIIYFHMIFHDHSYMEIVIACQVRSLCPKMQGTPEKIPRKKPRLWTSNRLGKLPGTTKDG